MIEEGGDGESPESGLRITISAVIHTYIRQSRVLRQTMSVWVLLQQNKKTRVRGKSNFQFITTDKAKASRGGGKVLVFLGLFSGEQKRAKSEGKKCHTTTMMSRKSDKTVR